MNIREFIPEDSADDKNAVFPAFLEIWNAPENLKYLSFTLKLFDQETVNIWLDNHKEQGVRYFGAVNKVGRILGIAVIKVNPIVGFEIYGVGVRPEFKRQGIGGKLIEHTICTASKLSYKAIDAVVFADNTAMLRLLLSLNFIPIGMDYHKRSDGADTVHLKRYL